MRPRNRSLWTGALLATATALALTATPAAAATTPAATTPADKGEVYVLQGLPGRSPSVTLDGRVVADDVATKTVVGPLEVAPGTHTVQLWNGQTPVAQAAFTARAGSSTDLVAHLFPDAGMRPAFTTYTNDRSPVPTGRSRVVVAHNAVAPSTDIVLDGRTLISNVANGEFATKIVPTGDYAVAVVPTATGGPAILGPTELQVPASSLVNVFAIGNPTSGGMDAIIQILPVASSGPATPSRVESGDGGQAAGLFPENQDPGSATTTAAFAGAVAFGGGLVLLRRRRSRP